MINKLGPAPQPRSWQRCWNHHSHLPMAKIHAVGHRHVVGGCVPAAFDSCASFSAEEPAELLAPDRRWIHRLATLRRGTGFMAPDTDHGQQL